MLCIVRHLNETFLWWSETWEKKTNKKWHKDLFHILSTFITREGEGGRAEGLLSVSLSQELFEAINIVNT